MSVIGRLDEQVWEKLIAPIAKRHEREAEELEKQEALREEEARAERDENGEAE